jgi:3-oxoacyl-[acyl-carrier-protein] synthase III
MAQLTIEKTRLAGVAAAVPDHDVAVGDGASIFGEEAVLKFAASTGVERRPVGGPLCSSDLCLAAAERLLDDLGWERDTVESLVFVSQTPDYLLPATSCSLHARLGLSRSCAAWDINLGCSGYTYGLAAASQFIQCGSARRSLLLVGDTINRIVSADDPSTALLFGDAGTATALERDETARPIRGVFGSDGSGAEHLIVPAGGFRQRTARPRESDAVRGEADLRMDGAEVFSFALREVPKLVKAAIALEDWQIEDVDFVVFHQANRFMLQHVAKRLKLPAEKLVLNLQQFGNTSCASIPLAMVDALGDELRTRPLRLVLVGFGVGFSWGATTAQVGPLSVPGLLRVPVQKWSSDASNHSIEVRHAESA